ncbi:MAG: two-component system response regulator [Deltaproteobacteria bacterium RBG_13_43_22]|nr:MAG: two-component system response regulator [Deltaproteobacteria bacterium RBG_13_43_22]
MAKIMIVDDASFMRSSLKYIIEKHGHTVVGAAADGKEAIALYPELTPDLVTLDILMKGMDGLTTLKALIKQDPQAKVLMVTAIGQESKQEEARKLGASGYIRKPFKPEDVTEEIDRVLGT